MQCVTLSNLIMVMFERYFCSGMFIIPLVHNGNVFCTFIMFLFFFLNANIFLQDFCYNEEEGRFKVIDSVKLCVTVIAYNCNNAKAQQMLVRCLFVSC